MMYTLLLITVMQLLAPGSFNTGELEIKSYSPRDFAAHGQNWEIHHASDNMLYIGNRYGILEFDGSSWSLIPSIDRRTVFSLAEDSDGSIYAGAEQMFAKLSAGDDGTKIFTSLNHLLPVDMIPGSIRYLASSGEGRFLFTDQQQIYLFDGETIEIQDLPVRLPLLSIQTIHENIILIGGDGKTFRYKDGKAEQITELSGRNVSALTDAGEGRILAATQSGLVMISPQTSDQIEIPAARGVDYNSVLALRVNSRSEIIMGTDRNGVYLFSPEGELIRHLTAGNGLSDNAVNRLGTDRDGGVWISQSRTLTRLGAPSNLTIYSDSEGLYGVVEQNLVYRGERYISGNAGVHRMRPAFSETRPLFEKVEGIDEECYDMVTTNEGLLVACISGVYRVQGLQSELIIRVPGSIVLTPSEMIESMIYLGTTDGFYRLSNSGSGWQLQGGKLPGISGFIRHIVETDDGSVWVATRLGNLQRISGIDGAPDSHQVETFGPKNGLPESRYRVFNLFGEAIASSSGGLFRFDDGVFNPDVRFQGLIPGDGMPNRMAVTGDSTILFSTGYENGKLVRGEDGLYKMVLLAAGRFPWQLTHSVQSGEEGDAWYGGHYGIAKINIKEIKPGQITRTPLIRQIASVQADSLFALLPTEPLQLENSLNGLRFSFVTPAFDPVYKEYRTRLLSKGSGNWSEWASGQEREFSSLQSGNYQFQVQARVGPETESDITSYQFAVLPPWYLSTSAMAVWGVFLTGLIVGFIRYRTARLKKYNLELERIILERTEEISQQKEKIEGQAEKLKRLDKLKSNFFTNLSHEFRTPLTLIRGPLEDLKSEKYGKLNNRQKELAALSHHNSHKLLHLINQLLELSKVEAGFVKLSPEDLQLDEFIRSIYYAFLPLAERHSVDFQFRAPDKTLFCRCDPDKIEKMVSNLLSNAFKAVAKDGRIVLELDVVSDQEDTLIRINVTDNGMGIPSEKLVSIFDRYEQGGTKNNTGQSGSGIGLNLVRELADLHGGTIRAESEPGIKTCFCLQLPFIKAESISLDEQKVDEVYQPDVVNGTRPGHTFPANGTEGDDVTTVLVVDDNPDIRFYISNHLKNQFRVLEADSGISGVELAEKHLPDLIISDVMMPGMDGIEMVGKLKSNRETDSIPIIFLTARASERQKVEGIGTGVDDYLTKPFNPDELVARVKNLMKNRKELRQKYSGQLTVETLELEIESVDELFMKQVTEVIGIRMRDPDFSSDELAREISMSVSSLQRKIKVVCGLTPNQLIRKTRVAQAKKHLQQGLGNISEIAFAVGFNSLSYFTRAFKQEYGESPSAFVNSVK